MSDEAIKLYAVSLYVFETTDAVGAQGSYLNTCYARTPEEGKKILCSGTFVPSKTGTFYITTQAYTQSGGPKCDGRSFRRPEGYEYCGSHSMIMVDVPSISTFPMPKYRNEKFPLGVYEDMALGTGHDEDKFTAMLEDLKAHNLDSVVMINSRIKDDDKLLTIADTLNLIPYFIPIAIWNGIGSILLSLLILK